MDHEELAETIRAVIAEERRSAISHPEERSKYTKFETPEGKTFTAVTLSNIDWLKNLAWIIGIIVSLLGAANMVYLSMVVEPLVDHKIAVHSQEAANRMADKAQGFVPMPLWQAWAADKERRWSFSDQREQERRAWEERMTEKIEALQLNQERIMAKLGISASRIK